MKILLIILLFIPMLVIGQTRPNSFIEYNNMPRWYKTAQGSLVVEKNGFTYSPDEFKLLTFQDNDHLFVYSTAEQVSFYCENFKSATSNVKSKIITINCYGNKENTYCVKHRNGGVNIVDKGENITFSGTVIQSGWDYYYQCNGTNGKKYFLAMGVDPSTNKLAIACTAVEPQCITTIR